MDRFGRPEMNDWLKMGSLITGISNQGTDKKLRSLQIDKLERDAASSAEVNQAYGMISENPEAERGDISPVNWDAANLKMGQHNSEMAKLDKEKIDQKLEKAKQGVEVARGWREKGDHVRASAIAGEVYNKYIPDAGTYHATVDAKKYWDDLPNNPYFKELGIDMQQYLKENNPNFVDAMNKSKSGHVLYFSGPDKAQVFYPAEELETLLDQADRALRPDTFFQMHTEHEKALQEFNGQQQWKKVTDQNGISVGQRMAQRDDDGMFYLFDDGSGKPVRQDIPDSNQYLVEEARGRLEAMAELQKAQKQIMGRPTSSEEINIRKQMDAILKKYKPGKRLSALDLQSLNSYRQMLREAPLGESYDPKSKLWPGGSYSYSPATQHQGEADFSDANVKVAPQAALDLLAQRPETAKDFQEMYGYLPDDFEAPTISPKMAKQVPQQQPAVEPAKETTPQPAQMGIPVAQKPDNPGTPMESIYPDKPKEKNMLENNIDSIKQGLSKLNKMRLDKRSKDKQKWVATKLVRLEKRLKANGALSKAEQEELASLRDQVGKLS